jgi:hypothetical protein
LNCELKEIDRINLIPGISRSDSHELGKYREFVNKELSIKDVPVKPEAPEKEYNSIKVARAFCLWELFRAGQLKNYYQIRPDGYYRFKRKRFENYIKDKFKLQPPESSATIYAQTIQFINSNRYEFYTKQAPEYERDYNYGLKLFNAME